MDADGKYEVSLCCVCIGLPGLAGHHQVRRFILDGMAIADDSLAPGQLSWLQTPEWIICHVVSIIAKVWLGDNYHVSLEERR